MSLPKPLPPSLTATAFTVGDAVREGVSAGRLRSSDLTAPFRGVRTSALIKSEAAAAMAYACKFRSGEYFSHLTALALWELPMPRRLEFREDRRIHITTPGRDDSVRARGVIGHRSTADPEPVFVKGLPVTSPIASWIGLWSVLALDELIVLGDAIVDPHDGFASRDDLGAALGRYGSRRGARILRRAFDEVREGSRSPQETLLRLALVRNGIRMPFLNPDVIDGEGRVLGQGDLVFGRERLVLEYEGDHHRTDVEQWRKDLRRRERFEDAGWRVVRVSGDETRDGFRTTVARVHRLLAERS